MSNPIPRERYNEDTLERSANGSPPVRGEEDCLGVQVDPLWALSILAIGRGSVTPNKIHWGCVPGLSRQPRSGWLVYFVSHTNLPAVHLPHHSISLFLCRDGGVFNGLSAHHSSGPGPSYYVRNRSRCSSSTCTDSVSSSKYFWGDTPLCRNFAGCHMPALEFKTASSLCNVSDRSVFAAWNPHTRSKNQLGQYVGHLSITCNVHLTLYAPLQYH